MRTLCGSEMIGEIGRDFDEPPSDGLGGCVEHIGGMVVVEALAIDEQKCEPMLRRKGAKLVTPASISPSGPAWSRSSISQWR